MDNPELHEVSDNQAGSQGAPLSDAASMPLSPLENAALTPIPGKNRAGDDATYDEDFLRIKAEIDRLGTVSARVDQQKVMQEVKEFENLRSLMSDKERSAALEAIRRRSALAETINPEFQLVIELGSKILSKKSKDIRVACYLCLALWRTKRTTGMAEGLAIILLLVREYWDEMFPPLARLTARRAALEFLIQNLAEGLRGSEAAPGEADSLEHARLTVASLEQELSARLGDNAPPLTALSKALEESLARLPKPSASLSQAPPREAIQAESPEPIIATSGDGEVRSLQAGVDQVRKVAAYLRAQDRKSPVSYRLLRCMRWDVIQNEPPSQNGKTQLEPPLAPRRAYLAGLKQQAQWDKLLEEAEVSFVQPPFHFWLDLQQFLISALEGLGPEYGEARTAVLRDLSSLHQRMPRLSTLLFIDGTPFACPATRAWLDEVVVAEGGSAGANRPAPSSGGDSSLAAAFEDAKKLVDRGDLMTAIAALEALALPSRSRRAQFERRLDMAMLCIRGDRTAMARPILEELNEEIDRDGLAGWDPPLVLETWKALARCYESLAATAQTGGKQALVEQAARIFEKICRLDVTYALTMSGARPKERFKPPSAQAAAAQREEVPSTGGRGDPARVKEKEVPALGT